MAIRRFSISPVMAGGIKIKEKIPIHISCVEVLDPDIYLGTVDSFILLYHDVFRYTGNDRQPGASGQPMPLYKYLGLKRSITQLMAVPVLNRILSICDGNLMLSHLDTLDSINHFKLRNVWACSINEKPMLTSGSVAFTVEVCLAKRKSLAIGTLHADRLTVLKEVALNEQPLAVAIEARFVCVACTANYYMVDWEANSQQLLCANDRFHYLPSSGTALTGQDATDSMPPPICKYIGGGEFLINGPSHLGVFVKTSGISERPPVDWGADVTHIAYHYPYILCLRRGTGIAVISLIDQKVKEEFPLPNGTFLGDFDGKIVATNTDHIWQLQHISWLEQIDSLLANEQCQEAIDLAQTCREMGHHQPLSDLNQRSISIRAGLIELRRERFETAQRFLSQASFEPRNAVWLNPTLAERLNLERPPPPETAAVQTLLDQIRTEMPVPTINRFLLNYLASSDEDPVLVGTVRLLVRLEDEPEDLDGIRTLLAQRPPIYDRHLIEIYLRDRNRNYHLALLYAATDRLDEAIELILKLERKTIPTDRYYPGGMDQLVPLLAGCRDSRIVLKHINVVLERNQRQGAEILLTAQCPLPPDTVMPMLQPYREALVIYLEHLVFDRQIRSESVHTTLALVYIEILLLHRETEQQDSTLCAETKRKLDHLLRQTPPGYDQRRVLASLIQNRFDYETAALYGQMGQHRKALDIYLGRYQDHRKALNHCLQTDDVGAHQALLETYMDLYRRNGPETLEPLLEYLNHGGCRLSLIPAIMDQFPDEWPVALLRRHLTDRLAAIWHTRFQTDMGRVLARSALETERKRKKQLMHRNPIRIDADSICTICRTRLLDSRFVWIPENGTKTSAAAGVAHDFCYYGGQEEDRALDNDHHQHHG